MMRAEEEDDECSKIPSPNYVKYEETSRPLGVSESLYQDSSDALLLEKMDDCRNPDLNTISHETMAKLINNKTLPFSVIDCRFDYEFEGGHIKGALNLNSPIKVEEYFFKLKDQIQTMMQQRAIVVFHCEFS